MLKIQNRLYLRTKKSSVVLRNGPISLLDQTFPGVNTLFDTQPKRSNGHFKWVDFVRRFTHKGALVAFAGMEAPPFQSGTLDSKSRHISKRGSPHLRRSLFQIASVILQHSNPNGPIFRFMDKKRAERKRSYVYTVAGAAKFPRICCARVKAHLAALDAGIGSAA